MNCVFFNSKTFSTREILNALKMKKDIKCINTVIPFQPPTELCETIFSQLKPFLLAIILSINDVGYDFNGKL